MKAKSAMTRNVVCISPKDSLSDAYEIMVEWEIRHLPVLAGDALVGILSDRDVILKAEQSEKGIVVPHIPVEEAMTPKPLTCGLFTDVAHLAATMVEHRIDSIPVVDESGALAGLVTSSDLLQLLAEEQEEAPHRILPFHWEVHAKVRPGMAKGLI